MPKFKEKTASILGADLFRVNKKVEFLTRARNKKGGFSLCQVRLIFPTNKQKIPVILRNNHALFNNYNKQQKVGTCLSEKPVPIFGLRFLSFKRKKNEI